MITLILALSARTWGKISFSLHACKYHREYLAIRSLDRKNELSLEYMSVGQLFLRVKDPEGQIASRTLKRRKELSQVQLTLG
jgi:hypothetical protein